MVCVIRHSRERRGIKRVQVTFTEEQWRVIEKFRGVMGNDDAEIVRNIVLAWLSEKSVVTSIAKMALKDGRDSEKPPPTGEMA
jgi:aryl-alcohol dehydrogenase-like predicted oxidoreductase